MSSRTEVEGVKEGEKPAGVEVPLWKRVLKTKARVMVWILAIAQVAGLLTSVRAVMDTRTAQGAVAWVISLNTFPIVAVPAYWVFGRSKFQGYVVARRSAHASIRALEEKFLTNLVERKLIAFPNRDRALLVEKLAKLPFTVGNDCELLVDGEATFKSIFEGIDRAKEYVFVQFYIIHDDSVGQELKRRVLARAKAGVRCAILYDEIGSGKLPESYSEELRAAGVQVRPFHSTKGSGNRFQINFRNHRKIVVVDGREAWVGGLNVGDEYKSLDPTVGFWRDTHLRMEGPVVQCVQSAFAEDWHWASGDMIEANWDPQPARSGKSRAMLSLSSGPADPMETCTLFFVNAINIATNRLWIASPYFVPDEQFITALQLAALRGVDVRILIPAKSDNALVQLSAWSYVPVLEEAGIKVFRYEKGFMHHKVVVVDDEYCTIGTANFDNRSFRLNFEITIGVADREFAGEVRAMLERDFESSKPIRAQELAERSLLYRFSVKAARLMAPVQ